VVLILLSLRKVGARSRSDFDSVRIRTSHRKCDLFEPPAFPRVGFFVSPPPLHSTKRYQTLVLTLSIFETANSFPSFFCDERRFFSKIDFGIPFDPFSGEGSDRVVSFHFSRDRGWNRYSHPTTLSVDEGEPLLVSP